MSLTSEDDFIEIDQIFGDTRQIKPIKKWKYPLDMFCLKHKAKFNFKCLTCEEKFCDVCSNKFHNDHEIEEIFQKQKEKYMNYALDFRINNVYCLSNIATYVNQKTKRTMLLFSTTQNQKICEFDLEARKITRQISTPQYFNHLIVIDNKTLLAGSIAGVIRLYQISNLEEICHYKQKSYIKQIIYFNKYKVIALLSDFSDTVYLLNNKLKIIRVLVNPIRGCTFNHIEKLNDTQLVSCSDIQTPILKWDITNGQIVYKVFKSNLGIQYIKTLNLNRVITISLSYSMVLRDALFRKINTITNKYSMIDYLELYNQQNIVFSSNLNTQITIFNIVKSKQLQNITLPSEIRGLTVVNNQIIATGRDLYIYSNKPVQISSYTPDS